MKNSDFIADHISQKLSSAFEIVPGETWTRIVTPFLDKHRNQIQLFAREEKDGWLLTDDGVFLGDLEMTYGSVPELIARTFDMVDGDGISFRGRHLEITCERDELFDSLMEAISISYRIISLEPAHSPVRITRFTHQVEKAISESAYPWRPHVHFVGASGYEHQFNFEVTTPYRGPSLLRVANNPSAKGPFESYLLALTDISKVENGVPVTMVGRSVVLNEEQTKVVERQGGNIVPLVGLIGELRRPVPDTRPPMSASSGQKEFGFTNANRG